MTWMNYKNGKDILQQKVTENKQPGLRGKVIVGAKKIFGDKVHNYFYY